MYTNGEWRKINIVDLFVNSRCKRRIQRTCLISSLTWFSIEQFFIKIPFFVLFLRKYLTLFEL